MTKAFTVTRIENTQASPPFVLLSGASTRNPFAHPGCSSGSVGMNLESTPYWQAEHRLRPSLRVVAAAAVLQVNTSTIYKLVRRGLLEGHRVGKRGVRVFADSLRDYQEGQKIGTYHEQKAPLMLPRKKRWKSATHQKALDLLRRTGVI